MTFLDISTPLGPVLSKAHGDLFEAAFRQAMQARRAAREVVDLPSYRDPERLQVYP